MSAVSGLLYQYYHICQRKVWYVANGISLEDENENVQIGSIIDDISYSRQRKHILIDEKACIDFMRDNTVYEIKKSSAEKDSALAQIKYYLYILEEKGIKADGELRIPQENNVEKVTLNEEDIASIRLTIGKINEIINRASVPPKTERRSICKKCAFFEFCYI